MLRLSLRRFNRRACVIRASFKLGTGTEAKSMVHSRLDTSGAVEIHDQSNFSPMNASCLATRAP